MRYFNRHTLFMSPSDDGGGAIASGADPTADGAGADAATSDDAESGTQEDGRTFTQDELDAILADRLQRQERKLRREIDKAQQEAADDKLKDEAQWQALADKRQSRISKLEGELEAATTQLEQLAAYEKTVKQYAAKLSDPLPDGVKALLAKLAPVDQLAWLTEHGATETAVPPSIPATPAASPSSKLTDDQRRQQAYRASL